MIRYRCLCSDILAENRRTDYERSSVDGLPKDDVCCQMLGESLQRIASWNGELHFQLNGTNDLVTWFHTIVFGPLFERCTGVSLPAKPKLKTEFHLLMALDCAFELLGAEMLIGILRSAIRARQAKGHKTHDLSTLLANSFSEFLYHRALFTV